MIPTGTILPFLITISKSMMKNHGSEKLGSTQVVGSSLIFNSPKIYLIHFAKKSLILNGVVPC
jgi:hypothetical protein